MPFIVAAVGAVIGAVSSAIAVVGAVFGALGLGAAATALATVAVIGVGVGAVIGLNALTKALRGSTDPPKARGSVTQTIIDPNAPMPYVMGEGPAGGVVVHDVGYGAPLNDVPNPYRFTAVVYSLGTIGLMEPYLDLEPIDWGYYSGFVTTDFHSGAHPELDSLAASFGTPPGWGSSSKLSGKVAIGWNLKFDPEGKVFAGGVPGLHCQAKWVYCYDPRKDSTFPGGSGAHRLGNEGTYEWTENPALHAATYAYGRYQNGKRVFGMGLPDISIDWQAVAAWANDCDANDWTIFGAVYEPDDRWNNLKDICAAGSGRPNFAGGILSFDWDRPRVSLLTITETDIADDDLSLEAMRSYRDRINGIRPKYRSPDHEWEMVNAAAVSVAAHVTEDGEDKTVEWPFNMVKQVDQAAQLARYVIENSREIQPIELTLMPQFRELAPGDAIDLDLPSLALDCQAVILHREIDPATLKVKLVLTSENPDKHAFALGQTGTPPAAILPAPTGAERDEVLAATTYARFGALRIEPMADVIVDCDSLLDPLPGQLPRVLDFHMFSGATEVSAQSVFVYTGYGCTVDDISFPPTITAVAAQDATVVLKVTYGEVELTHILKVTKRKVAIETPGGAGQPRFEVAASGTVSETVFDSTPHVLATGSCMTNAGGLLDVNVALAYVPVFDSGYSLMEFQASAKLQLDIGGVWTDWTSPAGGSAAQIYFDATQLNVVQGQLSFGATLGFLPASTLVTFRLVAVRSYGAQDGIVSGTFSGTTPA